MPPSTLPVVLLVENDPAWVIILTAMLAKEGAAVLGPAASAAEARALCAGPGPAPQLAVLDIGLNGPENGLRLGQWLRQHEGLPLLYLTGREQPTVFAQARNTAPLAFVLKSGPAAELHHALVLALDQARRRPVPAPVPRTHLYVPDATGECRVALADVEYVESQGHSSELVLAKARHLLRLPLHELRAQLHPCGFRQIHRRYLVNLTHLQHLDKSREEVRVGRTRLPLGESFRAALLRELL